MSQQPPSKKPTIAKRVKTQNDAAAKKRSEGDSYFDEFFQTAQSHQLDATPEPEQQRQWISDQLMWETTLGMREDDMINRAITPQGEDQSSAADIPQPSATPKKQLSAQERLLLRTQVTEPKTGQAAPAAPTRTNSAAGAGQPSRTTQSAPGQTYPGRTVQGQSVPRQAVTRQTVPRQTVPGQNKPGTPMPVQQQAPQQPVRNRPSAKSQLPRSQPIPPQTTPRPNPQTTSGAANPVNTSRAPVKRVSPPRPAASTAAKPVQTTSRNPLQQPSRQPSLKPGQAAGSGKSNVAANMAIPNVAIPKQNPAHTQSQPVNIATQREAEISIETQIETTIQQEVKREKQFLWAKKAAVIVSITIISFISGYYLGGKNADEARVAHLLATLEQLKSAEASKNKADKPIHEQRAPAKPKPMPQPKTVPAPVVTENSSPTDAEITASEATSPMAEENKQSDSGAVFEGRDIPLGSPEQRGNEQSTVVSQATEQHTDNFNATATEAVSGNFPENHNSAKLATAPPVNTNAVSETTAENSTEQQSEQQREQQSTQQKEIQDLLTQSLQAFNSKQWQTLVELSNKVLSLDPNAVNALTNRAAAYSELNLYGLALKDCNSVIAIDANNALAINNRGYVFEKMGDIQNAIIDYKAACALGVDLSCKEAVRLKQTAP